MATMCAASRRNSAAAAAAAASAVSATTTTVLANGSPQHQKISNNINHHHNNPMLSLLTANNNNSSSVTRMTSVHEEETTDSFDDDCAITQIDQKLEAEYRMKNKTCSERSDSGFSDTPCGLCSTTNACNCSTQQHQQPQLHQPLPTTPTSVVISSPLKSKASATYSNTIEIKLQPSADANELNDKNNNIDFDVRKVASSSPSPSSRKASLSRSFSASSAESSNNHTSATTIGTVKQIVAEPIMRSDFTNTITMRKQSLELNSNRDKSPMINRTTKVDLSGKVLKLKQKFSPDSSELVASSTTNGSQNSSSATATVSSTKMPPLKTNSSTSMDFRNVFERFNNSPPIQITPKHHNNWTIDGSRQSATLPRRTNNTNNNPRFQLGSSNSLIKFDLNLATTSTASDNATLQPDVNRSTSATRISDRVKSTTDRLTAAVSLSPIPRRKAMNGSDSDGGSINGGGRQRHEENQKFMNQPNNSFQKASAFWKT